MLMTMSYLPTGLSDHASGAPMSFGVTAGGAVAAGAVVPGVAGDATLAGALWPWAASATSSIAPQTSVADKIFIGSSISIWIAGSSITRFSHPLRSQLIAGFSGAMNGSITLFRT